MFVIGFYQLFPIEQGSFALFGAKWRGALNIHKYYIFLSQDTYNKPHLLDG